MVRAAVSEIRLRLVIESPVPGVVHSLQDKKNHPVDGQSSSGTPLIFELSVRVAAGPRFTGEFVRSEGPTRRFVYVAIGKHAGDPGSPWDRRMKIDIHTITQAQVQHALKGKVVEAVIAGTAADGSPVCATVKPTRAWRVVT